jgi:hypothetical protein
VRHAGALLLCLLAACGDRRREEPAAKPAAALPGPEVIARGVQSPMGLAVDDTYVYWGDGPLLRRARKRGGGAPEDVCRVEAIRIESIAVAPDAIYFGATGGGIFRRRAQEGAACERIASETDPSSLAVVGGQLHYWNGGAPHSVPRDRPADAPAPTSWQAGYTGALVTDGKHIFVHQLQEIGRVALDGTGFTPLGRTGHLGVAMAVDDSHLYWGDDLVDGVLRVPVEGGALEWFSPIWTLGATIAVDRDWVYVMDIDADVHAISKADGRSATVVDGTFNGTGTNRVALALDAEQFFLADDSSYNKTLGVAVVDLTRPGAELPAVVWDGHVARAAKRLTGVDFTARPAAVEAATVYFSPASDEAQDWNNATGFTRWRDERLSDAVRAGRLPVTLMAGVPDRDQARARRRAEGVAERIRGELGTSVVFDIQTRAGKDANVVVQFAPSAYAALWAP